MKPSVILSLFGSILAVQTPSLQAATSPRSSSPQPVLMVIANQDFYYQEYSDTRRSLEASGLKVTVAAAALSRCLPAPGTGQTAGSDGSLWPDLALSTAKAGDYSAIVFVGGWGSSMYQYAYNDPNFDGTIDSYYANSSYNGDDNLADGKVSEPKAAVNHLINDFVSQDKYVCALGHGVTVLAWARVDGVSPLRGNKVAATTAGSPATYYLGRWYGDQELSVFNQVVANGGFASPYSGQYGDTTTAADDVIVDGRIITAENHDSAALLGRVVASQVLTTKN